MRTQRRISRASFPSLGVAVLFLCVVSSRSPHSAAEPAAPKKRSVEELSLGRELFLREWLPNDPRSHGGDGLGPVFNDSSCVACHNQGGPGGAGPASKNVDLLTAFPHENSKEEKATKAAADQELILNAIRASVGLRIIPGSMPAKLRSTLITDELVKFHPGFKTGSSVMMHRSGTDADFVTWHPANRLFGESNARVRGHNDMIPLQRIIFPLLNGVPLDIVHGNGTGEIGLSREPTLLRAFFNRTNHSALIDNQLTGETLSSYAIDKAVADRVVVLVSQRNPPALFGVGSIDGIPESVIEAAAETRHARFPYVNGRVSRLAGGKIGRFGWKGQMASLREFTLTACAVELGLNVPGHEQAIAPYKPNYRSPGFDMNEPECDALFSFITSLPAPARMRRVAENGDYLDAGEKLFEETGCAACHLPRLGDVDGIYSDLLLHKMGPALVDAGTYGAVPPDNDDEESTPSAPDATTVGSTDGLAKDPSTVPKQRARLPRQSEWRTPPLWGLRDSGPYLHDGRAETIERAIAMHGGEALQSTNNFFKLSHETRQQMIGFLKSLTAPENVPKP